MSSIRIRSSPLLNQMCAFSMRLGYELWKKAGSGIALCFSHHKNMKVEEKEAIKEGEMKKLNRWGISLFIVKSWEYVNRKRPCVRADTLTTDRWMTTWTCWVMDEWMNNSIHQADFVFSVPQGCISTHLCARYCLEMKLCAFAPFVAFARISMWRYLPEGGTMAFQSNLILMLVVKKRRKQTGS